ncbi:hypothetical protein TVAG_432240 [Trichomonas vaginalis G3]|uniref:DDE-1 domain-containing protein n=1 Tax=Trichomonas vaginalis (strain ATCC PRA-98 / G3) TaxID=412133 RepID=A2F8T8_TRIV3|nr:hypothetical protein TVAGG3_0126620 [Trichomonas vaginalis G3]EAX98674.1 hypothetical protein TVAG_432240 [Trichomonas vaginalis G3]KAI5545805.1 hypothetical protein TVAGG3_0126620 [Trichomonas vaginalis G3]|eukprot:XP_001311604.1 hypothetical protein [Trichomonas vaginalis G3]
MYLQLSGDQTLLNCLKLSAFGFRWEPHQRGGSRPCLSPSYENRTKCQVHYSALDHDCDKTIEVLELIHLLRNEMFQRARQRLRAWGAAKLATSIELDEIDYSSQFLNEFCNRIGIYIKSPTGIEEARRQWCNMNNIRNFFSKFKVILLNVNPFFLFNMDETGLSIQKPFRIITNNKKMNLSPKALQQTQITALCCFNATGYTMNPIFYFLIWQIYHRNSCRYLHSSVLQIPGGSISIYLSALQFYSFLIFNCSEMRKKFHFNNRFSYFSMVTPQD